MKIAVEDVRQLMVEVCLRRHVPAAGVSAVVDHYLEGELRGKATHGVAKFCFESQFFSERRGDPFVNREFGAVAVVDGNREVGPLSAAFAADVAARKAQEFGVGLVGLINTQRYGILGTWTESLAQRGLMGIVMNTSTADTTIPGSRIPFLGVNPLSFAVETNDSPLVVDMSTTRAPMGNLWNARRGVDDLAVDAFVDQEGVVTGDPHEAVTALVFGGHKGMALSMLVQFMTGSLFGFPMGDAVTSVWETGYVFLALSPVAIGGSDAVRNQNSAFLDGMRKNGLRVPGEVGDRAREAALQHGTVVLPDRVFEELQRLAGTASGVRSGD